MLDSLHAGHVLALAVYGAMILILRGRLGRGAGLHDLFRDKAAHAALFNDPPVRERAQAAETKGKSWQLWLSPGFTTMALFTLWIGITLILLGLPLPPVLPSDAGAVGPVLGWTALGALLVLSLFALAFGRLPRGQAPESGETAPALLRRALGLGAGLLAVVLLGVVVLPMLQAGLLPFIDPSGPWWGLLSTLALFVLALLAMVTASWMWVQTGAAWFMLLIVLTTGFALLAQVPVLLLLLAGGALLVWLVRRLVPFRYRIPGIPARYYENPISPHAPPTEPPPALVPPQKALAAWHSRDHAAQDDKPRLVMLALSGGGYRATFWASAVLDELIALDGTLRPDGEGGAGEGLDGLARSIRFIAGASGGMVTGAYLAELSARVATGGPMPETLTGLIEQMP